MADQDRLREFPLLIKVKDQTGGLNTRTFGTEIQDNEAQEMKNLFADPGLLKKREGTDTYGVATGASGAVRGILNFKPDDNSSHNLLFAVEDGIYSCNNVGVVSLRATMASSDLQTAFVQGLNKAYVSNGTDPVVVIDTSLAPSALASGSTAMPKHTTSEYFLNMLMVNDVNNPSWIHFSDALADNFSIPGRTLKLGEGSGNSEIVALKSFRNREVLVFMNNRIEEVIIGSDLSDVATWDIKTIDDRYGLGARDSIREIGGIVYFIDNERNVRALNRTALDAPTGTQVVPISDKIEAEMLRINKLHISKVSAGVNENLYLLSVPLDDATENSHIFVFDTRQGAWYGPWDLKASKLVESDLREQGNDTFFGNSTNGSLIRMFDGSYDDDEVAIETCVITKKYDFNRPESDKIFNEIEIACLGTGDGTVTVQARVDSTGFTDVGTFNIVSNGPKLPIDLPFDLGGAGIVRGKFHLEGFSRGRNIDFRFIHDETFDVQFLEWIVTVLDQNYSKENF